MSMPENCAIVEKREASNLEQTSFRFRVLRAPPHAELHDTMEKS